MKFSENESVGTQDDRGRGGSKTTKTLSIFAKIKGKNLNGVFARKNDFMFSLGCTSFSII